jgi:hypothetical protein
MSRRPVRFAAGLLVLAGFLLSFSCSIPNLESPDCAAARQNVREFYSIHFGNDMKFSPENLALREKFLTPEFASSLKGRQVDGDIFTTGTNDIPKAFRVGRCEITPRGSARLEVVLFWKDDVRSEQRPIYAEAVKRGDTWLVDSISDR